jgi:hypothetical protein
MIYEGVPTSAFPLLPLAAKIWYHYYYAVVMDGGRVGALCERSRQ